MKNSREWEETEIPCNIETMENSREWEQIERPWRIETMKTENGRKLGDHGK